MAAVRQKFHLARCSNLPSHLFFGHEPGSLETRYHRITRAPPLLRVLLIGCPGNGDTEDKRLCAVLDQWGFAVTIEARIVLALLFKIALI